MSSKTTTGAGELTNHLLRLTYILWIPLCRINKLGFTSREDYCDPLYLWVINGRDITFHGIMIRSLGFSPEEVYMGEGAASMEACGPHTMWCHAGGDPRRHVVWGLHGPPPTLLWTPCRVGENRDLAFRFVLFQKYLLNNFSETKNCRKQSTGTVASC